MSRAGYGLLDLSYVVKSLWPDLKDSNAHLRKICGRSERVAVENTMHDPQNTDDLQPEPPSREELNTLIKDAMKPIIPKLQKLIEVGGGVHLRHAATASESIGAPKTPENVESAQAALPDLEMPLSAKYMLLASYIASHNPARLDERVFGTAGAHKKRRRMLAAEERRADAMEQQWQKGRGIEWTCTHVGIYKMPYLQRR